MAGRWQRDGGAREGLAAVVSGETNGKTYGGGGGGGGVSLVLEALVADEILDQPVEGFAATRPGSTAHIARSLKVLVWLFEVLESAGVAFRSATGPIETSTATGRMLIQLLGVFAEFERATMIDRVIAGMERKAARGGWTAGRRPYGLTVERDTTGQVINEGRPMFEPAEFPVVERIFSRYAQGQEGAVAIAAELDADGLRTRSGQRWSAKVVLAMLRNRVYLGEVYFRGSWHPSTEPFIEPALFDRVQAILDRRGEGYTARNTDTHPEYLLSGLITCERCGRRYIGASARGKRHRYRYYVCWTRSRYGNTACTGERIRADALEDAVLNALIESYAHPDILAEVLAESRQQSAAARQHDKERRAIEAELKRTELAVERYMHAFENGAVTEDMFGHRSA